MFFKYLCESLCKYFIFDHITRVVKVLASSSQDLSQPCCDDPPVVMLWVISFPQTQTP